jgi:hypothetical protein
MGEKLLEIENVHIPDCGEPPHLTDTDTVRVLGYLRNGDGDQWVCYQELHTGRIVARCGDLGWEQEYELRPDDSTGKLVLRPAERAFLAACVEEARF